MRAKASPDGKTALIAEKCAEPSSEKGGASIKVPCRHKGTTGQHHERCGNRDEQAGQVAGRRQNPDAVIGHKSKQRVTQGLRTRAVARCAAIISSI